MKKIRKGFTLAEVLVVLSVLGVVAAVTMPMLNHIRPNQEQVMLKKAYYLIGRNVTELVNDDDFYIDTGIESTAGFANTSKSEYHGHVYGSDNAAEDEALQKFCQLFATKMNIQDDANCVATISMTEKMKKGVKPEGHFVTADGMVWILPISNFSGNESIYIDVNGDKAPNCFSAFSTIAEDYRCAADVGPDRFEIKVDKYGKLTVPDKVSKWYLRRTDNTKTYSEVIEHEKKLQKKDNVSDLN